MKKLAQIFILLSTLFFLRTEVLGAEPPDIRVAVIENVQSVEIQSLGGGFKERVGSVARISIGRRGGLMLKGVDRGREMTLKNASGRYRIGNRTFKGTLKAILKDNGSISIINSLSLEDYLAGLINSEISSSWPEESIKAQAIAARSYAINQIEAAKKSVSPRPFDLTSTVLDQVYDGTAKEDSRSSEAVAATHGEMLLRGGQIFPAYYHSCCGGHTEHAHNVWEGETGPPTIKDTYCARSPKFSWSFEIPISQFIDTMRSQGTQINSVNTIASSTLSDSPRVGELIIEDEDTIHIIKATDLRRIFGYQNIKSTWFEVQAKQGKMTFTGRGYGHGVGMCQWGAKGMAEEGFRYREILKFYYPDAEIVRLY